MLLDDGSVRDTLRFDAFGRRFEVTLEVNARLNRLRSGRGYDAFRGEVSGSDSSWVRVTRDGEELTGIIFDAGEVYVVEPRATISRSLVQTEETEVINLIYRLADAIIAPGSLTCATGPMVASQNGQEAFDDLLAEVTGAETAEAQGATIKITVAAIGDFPFFNQFGSLSSSESAMLARFNIVDGIFTEQLGIEIDVEDLTIFTSAAQDPFSSTSDPGSLLDELSDYRSANQTQYGHSHLVTGRDLNSSTAGIAFLGDVTSGGRSLFGICMPETAAALSQSGGFSSMTSALVIAHEIGHNFGAPHDAEAGSPCAATPDTFLMAPRISSTSTFSSCSLQQMQPIIDAATCFGEVDVIDAAIEFSGGLLAGGQSVLDETLELEFTVSSAGGLDASVATVVVDPSAELQLLDLTLPGATCAPSAASCELMPFPGAFQETLLVTVRGTVAGAATLSANVTATGDTNQRNDTATIEIEVTATPTPMTTTGSSSGGGGGSLGCVTLIALLVARRSRREA